jgi:uncharacterized flavoprotein (TIGR03862 family)
MAAEMLAKSGLKVTVYDQKPSPARKFLMAGRGGLNITHSEPLDQFLTRYGSAASFLAPSIRAFPPEALRAWCAELGQETFTGSSGRVFPKSMKASPLLRAWLTRLSALGIGFVLNTAWEGWNEGGELVFTGPNGPVHTKADITLLALGGASWPKLGSAGNWTKILAAKNIPLAPFKPSNCGFLAAWSDTFRERFTGTPIKSVHLRFEDIKSAGDLVITKYGIEGGPVYALSSRLRDEIERQGKAVLHVDLRPGLGESALTKRLSAQQKRDSFSNFLRKTAGLCPAAIGLLRETEENLSGLGPEDLTARIKACPIPLISAAPIERAISSAGGIRLEAIDENFMLRDLPGVYAIGEMLDWEAPTGGYLLQATFSMAVRTAQGIIAKHGPEQQKTPA